MKDIFDNPNFGEFNLNSRIVRTGLWESQNESRKNLSADIFLRYETLSKNNVGLITTELISLYSHDRFSDYSHSINSPLFIKDFKEVTSIVHQFNVPILAQVGFVNCNVNGKQMIEVNDLTIEDIRKIQADYLVAAKKVAFAGFDGIQLRQYKCHTIMTILDTAALEIIIIFQESLILLKIKELMIMVEIHIIV